MCNGKIVWFLFFSSWLRSTNGGSVQKIMITIDCRKVWEIHYYKWKLLFSSETLFEMVCKLMAANVKSKTTFWTYCSCWFVPELKCKIEYVIIKYMCFKDMHFNDSLNSFVDEGRIQVFVIQDGLYRLLFRVLPEN